MQNHRIYIQIDVYFDKDILCLYERFDNDGDVQPSNEFHIHTEIKVD